MGLIYNSYMESELHSSCKQLSPCLIQASTSSDTFFSKCWMVTWLDFKPHMSCRWIWSRSSFVFAITVMAIALPNPRKSHFFHGPSSILNELASSSDFPFNRDLNGLSGLIFRQPIIVGILLSIHGSKTRIWWPPASLWRAHLKLLRKFLFGCLSKREPCSHQIYIQVMDLLQCRFSAVVTNQVFLLLSHFCSLQLFGGHCLLFGRLAQKASTRTPTPNERCCLSFLFFVCLTFRMVMSGPMFPVIFSSWNRCSISVIDCAIGCARR